MNHLPLDFIATIYYKTTEEGGRKTPAKNGYRPQIKFPFEVMQNCACQTFIDTEWVSPGETIEAEIRMFSSRVFEGRLSMGQIFELREGMRIVATGVIKEIINESLRVRYEINTMNANNLYS